MALISDSLALRQQKLQRRVHGISSPFWRETLNRCRFIPCCLLCITIFTNPLPEDDAVFFTFFLHLLFLGPRTRFRILSLLEEELVLLASTFSCGNNVTKTGKWDISHILNLRAREDSTLCFNRTDRHLVSTTIT